MKAKLLRRLRKEAKEKFYIRRYGKGFAISNGIYPVIRPDDILTIEEAVSDLIKQRRKYILDYVRNERKEKEMEQINKKYYDEI